MFDVINDDNFFLYAAKNYDNPSCTGLDDFYEDLNHIKYIKRLLNRFTSKGELKEGLIINHILSIYNIFGNEAGTKILFFKTCQISAKYRFRTQIPPFKHQKDVLNIV